MSDHPTFDGSESPAEIAKAAIEWFGKQAQDADFSIVYKDSIPMMKYELHAGDVGFVCLYRLDTMLEAFYEDAERIFDENVKIIPIEPELRTILLPHIAFSGMSIMLSRLLILQAQIFLENADDARVVTSGVFLHSLVSQSEHKKSLGRSVSKTVQQLIDESVARVVKKKRDYLVGFVNSQPLLHIPTSKGRPLGATKSEEKRQADAAQFTRQIEDAIRSVIHSGQPLTKTAVAKLLCGGVNPKTGTDSSLSVFGNKLRRLKIDYPAIVERVRVVK
jgi:hypothetical protein